MSFFVYFGFQSLLLAGVPFLYHTIDSPCFYGKVTPSLLRDNRKPAGDFLY
jgi:hypothetical protein